MILKIFRQSIIILSIYFLGEFISKGLSLPIPGNILGMIILFLALISGVLKLEKIQEVANFFIDHLAFFFIPAGVGLMTAYGQISGSALEIIMICVITTIIVMAVTGVIVQFLSQRLSKDKEGELIDGHYEGKGRRPR